MATKRFYYNLQGFSDLFVDLTDGSNPVLMYRVEGGDLNVLPTKGKDGEDGEDGKSCYVYWAWCEDPATGTGFSLTTPAKYISFIKSETPIASPAFGDFSIWGQQRGDDGDDGVSSYLYVAYASDSAGTGFSLTWSNGLKYRAEIISRTEIATPTLSDFANATWAKFIGDDGSADTEDVYSALGISSSGSASNFLNEQGNFVEVESGSSYTFDDPLSVNASNVVSIAKATNTSNGVASFNLREFFVQDGSVSLRTRQDQSTGTFIAIDYVKEWETYTDGSWYRLWASGWLEQGGNDTSGTGNRTISLPMPFADTSYNIQTTYNGGLTSTGGSHAGMVVPGSTTVSSFTLRCRYGAANAVGNSTGDYFWYACGWS